MQLGLLMLELTRQRSAQVYGTHPDRPTERRQPRRRARLLWAAVTGASRRDPKVEALRDLALFSGLSRRELAKVAKLVDRVDLPAGYTFIHEGESGREFFVIADGAVNVSQDGQPLAALGAGAWVGEIALMSDSARTATVATRTPTQLFVATERGFRELVTGWKSVARRLERSRAERTSAAHVG